MEYPTAEKLAQFISMELDTIVSTIRPMVLSKGQQQLFMSGLGRAFAFVELQLPREVKEADLLVAWKQLVDRYDILRTVLDVDLDGQPQSITNARQWPLQVSDMPLSETLVSLRQTAEAKDMTLMRDALNEAAAQMKTVPPVRLLILQQASSSIIAYLATSRLLLDTRSLRILGGELTDSCKSPSNAINHHRERVNFFDELCKGPCEPKKLLEEEEDHEDCDTLSVSTEMTGATAATAATSSEDLVHHPQALSMPIRAAPTAVASEEMLVVPSQVAYAIDAYCLKYGVTPSSILLSSFMSALSNGSHKSTVRVVVDIDQIESQLDMLGPLAVPMVMEVNAADVANEPAAVAGGFSHGMQDDMVSLIAPAYSYVNQCHGDYRFTYQHADWTCEGGSVNGPTLSSKLDLSIIAELGGDCSINARTYTLRLAAPSTTSCQELRVFAEKVVACASRIATSEGAVTTTAPSNAHTSLSESAVEAVKMCGSGLMGLVVLMPVLYIWPHMQSIWEHHGLLSALAVSPLAFHAMGLMMCSIIIMLHHLLTITCGSLAPGDYPTNTWPFLRWWFMSKLVSLSGPIYTNHIQGTPLYTWWLRGLGAQVGSGVHIMSGAVITDPQLVVMDDNAVVATGAKLMGSVIKGDVLHRGVIHLGRGSVVGDNATMMLGSTLGRRAVLKAQSMAPEGRHMAENSIFEGTPACYVGPSAMALQLRPTLMAYPINSNSYDSLSMVVIHGAKTFFHPPINCLASAMTSLAANRAKKA